MDKQHNNKGYRYQQQPLTPAVIQDLILELFPGKLVERRIIVAEVLRVHIARGGVKPRAADLPRSVKKALATMNKSGLADNPSFGFWRIVTPAAESSREGPIIPPAPADTPASEDANAEKAPAPEAVADLVVGEGSSAIYLYYLPIYRIRAEERGETVWPCKIGRTDRDPLTRVLSQASTALPERPHIALVVRTQHPGAWESALHGILTLRGLRVEEIPGSEWFLTSPEEVLAIARVFDPHLGNSNQDRSTI